MILKIVSGGQIGVDQGALDAAMALGLDWGGWAAKGWRAENGTIGVKYRLNMRELASSNYLVRTRRNVADSDATLILADGYPLEGGTLKTRLFCEEMMRPHLVATFSERNAVEKVQTWLAQFLCARQEGLFVLNVAGPRESKAHGIRKRTCAFLKDVYARLKALPPRPR